MKKIAGIAAVFVLPAMFLHGNSFAAEKRTDKLYELYNSTSTPEPYKRILKRLLDKEERVKKLRGNARRAAQNRILSAPAAVNPASVSSVSPLAADSAFKLGEVYCYPNPAKKTNPTFHIETGQADKVELKVYDIAGDIIHETVLTGLPQVIDDGKGPQYAYEYL